VASFSNFPIDRARALAGPAWLQEHRVEAAERVHGALVPTTDEEEWRYSRIGELDLDRFQPLVPQGDAPANLPAAAELGDELVATSGRVALCNGRLVERQLDAGLVDKGMVVGPLAEFDDGAGVVERTAVATPDLFTALNDAFAPEPVVIRVPDGVEVDAPLLIRQWIEADGLAAMSTLLIELGANSSLTVVDVEQSTDVTSLSVPVVRIRVGRGARLGYLNLQETSSKAWRIARHEAEADAQSTVVLGEVALGGDYSRTRTDCRLAGRGATGDLRAAYLGEGEQTLDFRTFQDHIAPDTTSDLLFKGVVGGRSRAVYTGLIHVGPDARGTNAFQTNRNIKLSEHAWAESVPNLEIENNDVHCSHASAVGPVDEEQLFYLESRGVRPEDAERLIVTGFFDEAIQKLPVPAARPLIERRLAARLSGSLG
jgi:Fe-S cluster assembly protein SufD